MDPSASDKGSVPDPAPNPVDDDFATIIPRRWMFMNAYKDAQTEQAALEHRDHDE